MDTAILTDSLCEFYTATEIRTLWREVLDATTSRAQLPIHINSRSRDGSSSSGISLSTIDECNAFMRACKAAVVRLEPSSATAQQQAADLGTQVTFAHRPVLV